MDRSEAGKLGYVKAKDILDRQRLERSQRVRDEYENNPKFCLTCGEIIPFEKRRSKFCDHPCAASYNNLGVTRNLKHKKFCSCGNRKKAKNKYCSECIEKRVYNKVPKLETAKSDRIRKEFFWSSVVMSVKCVGFRNGRANQFR